MKKKVETEKNFQKEMEEEMHEIEASIGAVITSATDSILVIDSNGNILFWNESAKKTFGYKKEEALGKNLHSLIVPAHYHKAFKKGFRSFKNSGAGAVIGQILEVTALRKDGLEFPVELSLSSVIIEGSWYAVGIIRDITDRKKVEEELQSSEERLKILFDYAPDAYYLNDITGTFIDCNKATEKVTGYKREELIGKSFLKLNLLASGQLKKAAKLLIQNKMGKATGPDELNILHKEGREIPVEIRTIPVRIKGESIVLGIARDISERKKAEDARLEAEKRYREIFENAVEGIFQSSLDGKFIKVNPSMAQILGYSSPETLIKNRTDIRNQGYVYPERREEFVALIEKKGKVVNFEFQVYNKSGQKIWLSENVRTVRDSGGKILYYEGTAEDITKRKQAEKKLSEYSENLEYMVEERSKELQLALTEAESERDKVDGILKSLSDGLIVIDSQNRIILMNREAEILLNVRLSEIKNQSIDLAIRDNTLKEMIAAFVDRKEPKVEFDFDIPGEYSQPPRVIRARTSTMQDKTGANIGAIIIMNDVTYEREVDRMKTEFITSAAHELRTPVTSIRGFSEILMSKGDIKEEEKEKFLSYINQQSLNLTAILNDLFVISRIESRQGIILNRDLCEISEIVKDVISNFQNQFPKYKIKTTMPSDPVKLMLDETRIKDVLVRILSNAVKFSSERSSILIKGEILNADFQLSIEDKGIGMSPDTQKKVFNKYYRADTTDSSLEGAGLGLTIVKHMIETQGGKVWIESELGRGTIVKISLPLENETDIK